MLFRQNSWVNRQYSSGVCASVVRYADAIASIPLLYCLLSDSRCFSMHSARVWLHFFWWARIWSWNAPRSTAFSTTGGLTGHPFIHWRYSSCCNLNDESTALRYSSKICSNMVHPLSDEVTMRHYQYLGASVRRLIRGHPDPPLAGKRNLARKFLPSALYWLQGRALSRRKCCICNKEPKAGECLGTSRLGANGRQVYIAVASWFFVQ